MEERGFLSEKFGQFEPSPSPTGWARVQQIMNGNARHNLLNSGLFFRGFIVFLLMGSIAAFKYWPLQNKNELAPKTVLTQKADLNLSIDRSSKEFKTSSMIVSDLFEQVSGQNSIIDGTGLTLGVKTIGGKFNQKSKAPFRPDIISKNMAILSSLDVTYMRENNQENVLSSSYDSGNDVFSNQHLTETVNKSNLALLESISNKTAELESNSGLPEAPIINLFEKPKPNLFVSYPVSYSVWGGLMMNYYKINTGFNQSNSKLPSALSLKRTGFEVGVMMTKPISSKVDGFFTGNLGVHQYKAELNSIGDSLIGLDASSGSNNELVYSGQFRSQTHNLNLKALFFQLSGGALFRNLLGPASLRIGAGVILSQTRTEALSSTIGLSNKSSLGFNACLGTPFYVSLNSNHSKLRIEPTIQLFFNETVHVSGMASLQPVQLGIRFGLE